MPDAPTPPDKHPGGRPSKLTGEFIAAAHEVIDAADNALIYTDEELLFQIYEKLSSEARIGLRTFERWKAGDIQDDVEGQEFRRLIQKALVKQKAALFQSLKTEPAQWQRYAWIIERKFDEWNLKRKVGVTKAEDGAAALATALLGADDEDDAAPAVPDAATTGGNAPSDAPRV
jgi:hypothetical protein